MASFLTDFFDLFGFVLLVVTGSAAFISFVAWRSRGSKHPVVLGLSLFLFFLTWRVMLTQFLALMPHSIAEYRDAWHEFSRKRKVPPEAGANGSR